MSEAETADVRATLGRILTTPTPDDLWRLQAGLLAVGTEAAHRAREVAREFHRCLRELDSKCASRSASRWGAVLATAAVSSVGLQEMLAEQEDPLRRLLASGVTALLEAGSAAKHVQAWEIEASLMYYDLAWYLYGELWDVSAAGRTDLASAERRTLIDDLVKPVMDPEVTEAARSALLVRLFQIVLAARVWPLLPDADDAPGKPGG